MPIDAAESSTLSGLERIERHLRTESGFNQNDSEKFAAHLDRYIFRNTSESPPGVIRNLKREEFLNNDLISLSGRLPPLDDGRIVADLVYPDGRHITTLLYDAQYQELECCAESNRQNPADRTHREHFEGAVQEANTATLRIVAIFAADLARQEAIFNRYDRPLG